MGEDNMAKSSSHDHHLIDIPENDELDYCWNIIHRVPRKLRKVNESAYTPQIISIGPYHHGAKELQAMERRKDNYLAAFLERTKKSEKDLMGFVSGWCEKILESYEEGTAVMTGDLERMFLRDSCFVLELLLRNDKEYAEKDRISRNNKECAEKSWTSRNDKEYAKKDRILNTPWLRKAVKLDLILLENQLPFFFLKELFDELKLRSSPRNTETLAPKPDGFSLKCYGSFKNPNNKKNPNNNNQGSVHQLLEIASLFFEEHYLMESRRESFKEIKEIKHFTDLLREFWLPRKIMSNEKTKLPGSITDQKYLYCAKKLDSAGVTFEPAIKERSLADIYIFKKPVLKFVPALNFMLLKLPELKIESETECLIRNVMALELCLYPEKDYICGYVALMDQLINTVDDVDFLVEKKILTNLLGSNEEAAKLFNGLCSHIPRDKSYYARFHNELNAFYENRWNVTRATFKKVYFKDLWTGSSTVVGIFVLLFTITATTRNVYLR